MAEPHPDIPSEIVVTEPVDTEDLEEPEQPIFGTAGKKLEVVCRRHQDVIVCFHTENSQSMGMVMPFPPKNYELHPPAEMTDTTRTRDWTFVRREGSKDNISYPHLQNTTVTLEMILNPIVAFSEMWLYTPKWIVSPLPLPCTPEGNMPTRPSNEVQQATFGASSLDLISIVTFVEVVAGIHPAYRNALTMTIINTYGAILLRMN